MGSAPTRRRKDSAAQRAISASWRAVGIGDHAAVRVDEDALLAVLGLGRDHEEERGDRPDARRGSEAAQVGPHRIGRGVRGAGNDAVGEAQAHRQGRRVEGRGGRLPGLLLGGALGPPRSK